MQTYDNGEVVRWIDTAPEGAPEPEHPAPVVKLTPANATQEAVTAATGAGDAHSSAGTWGVVLGIVGIVLGVIGIIVGLLNRRSATAG